MKALNSYHWIFLMVLILIVSCKKEKSCEGCATKNNKPPIAIAGPDQLITLPTDSIVLDGRSSSDPDGTISVWLWTKISGPAFFTIIKPADSLTNVKALVAGSYLFELKVTDNGGLSAKDTMQVIVDAVVITNHPPIANAGADQIITLPTNTVNLDGSGSSDPDNNITSYVWTKISGPLSFNIANASTIQTQVTNLVQGVYNFELKVTDAGGLFSKDTMQVIVNLQPPPPQSICSPFNRPIINAQLIPFGTLSEARTMISVASAGNKILFAGGLTSAGTPSSTVDIYDISTQLWSTTQLSVARSGIEAVSVGNKIYFAGGRSQNIDTPSSRVDIYDVISNSWAAAQLSEPRTGISASTIGSKIFFAGGTKLYTCSYCFSDRIDIYDISTNSWSTATLSVARKGMSATAAGNKIYFAGGHDFFNGSSGTGVYDQIDIYDNTTNTWTISALAERKAHHGAFAFGNYIYWAGGELWNNINDYETTCNVERRDLLNGSSTILHLFQPSFANSNSQPGMETLLKNGSIVFYTGGTQFDIYDPVAEVWSIGVMNQGFDFAGVISVNNIIYIAGGGFPYYTPPSNQVWKLEF
jgi:hypothetical protein